MNRNTRRVTPAILLIGLLAQGTLAFGQQRPVVGQSQAQDDPRQRRAGNQGVERVTNLQPSTSEGWQPGQEPPRGGTERLPLNQAGGGRAPNQVQQPPQPRMPFTLTPQEEANLDQILIAWERQSSTIKTYKCEFTRWEYGTLGFGQNPADRNRLLTTSTGELKYSAPDKGMFKVTFIELYNSKTGKNERGGPENFEHWVCDGKSIFEIDHKEKTRTQRALPPEMQGTAISDGPLPFVFGAKAAKLKQRYWMREISSPNPAETIWLQAYPRYQADAANFKYVEVIIGRKDFMPRAIQMFDTAYDPQRENESRTAFHFEKISFNGALDNVFTDFVEPKVPFGYKKIVLQPTVERPANNALAPKVDQRSARSPKGAPAAR